MHAQDSEYDSLLEVYLKLDSVWLAEIERDSLNIFSLLDSLVAIQQPSQLVVRTNYNSQVFNAGRSYGIDQYAFNSGISYYHRSGVYADISGQYYSGISPHYNATSVTLGYSNFFSNKWGYNLSASHSFYHELEESTSLNNTLKNSLGMSTFYYTKYITLGLDYIYSFGSENTDAHRLVPSLTIKPKLKAKGLLKRFKINPMLYMTFGTQTLYTEQYNNLVVRNIIQEIGLRAFLIAYRNNNPTLLDLIYEVDESSQFGPLNLQVTIPVQYTYKKFTASISYNINMPITLPSEILEEDKSSYVGVSVYYVFDL